MDVINLYGGPGTGKSTTAAGVFYELKRRGVNTELHREWIKGPVWDGYRNVEEDQFYILAKHARELARFKRGGVEVVVSDSPLLLSVVYGLVEGPNFAAYALDLYRRYDNVDIMLVRTREWYQEAGRMQTQHEALNIDLKIHHLIGTLVALSSVQEGSDAVPQVIAHWEKMKHG